MPFWSVVSISFTSLSVAAFASGSVVVEACVAAGSLPGAEIPLWEPETAGSLSSHAVSPQTIAAARIHAAVLCNFFMFYTS